MFLLAEAGDIAGSPCCEDIWDVLADSFKQEISEDLATVKDFLQASICFSVGLGFKALSYIQERS